MSAFGKALHNVITPEMAHDVIESPIFLWTTRIIDAISTLIIGFILCLHCYTIINFDRYRANRSAGKSAMSLYEALESWKKILNILTIFFILSQYILLFLLTLNIWEVIPTIVNCDIIVLLIVTLYHLSKSIFYCILITRLQVAFYLSSLKYSNISIILLYIFVILYTIFVCFGTPFIIFGVWLHSPINWCHIHTHDTIYSSISIGIWIFLDVIISIILCYLFIRPIKKVLKLSDQKQIRFTSLYIKYALLTYISIILNLISLLLYLFHHLTILIEITAAINCICIILMHTSYQYIFKYLCGCIVRHFTHKKQETIIRDKNERIPTTTTTTTTTNNTAETIALKHELSSEQSNYTNKSRVSDLPIGPDGGAIMGSQIPEDSDEYSQDFDSITN